MEIVFTSTAIEDLNFFIKSGNKSILKKISQLTDNMRINPTQGIGKPEQLKHSLSTCWSRRINKEHRIVYQIEENRIYIYSLKGHY